MNWIKYRNYLMSLACTMDKNTIEYRNINRRIKYAHERAYRVVKEAMSMTVNIRRSGRKIELSMPISKTKVYNAAEVWEANGYIHVVPQDIENYKEIKWKGIEFNRLVSKGGKLYRFNGWVGLYPYERIEIEEIGTIH